MSLLENIRLALLLLRVSSMQVFLRAVPGTRVWDVYTGGIILSGTYVFGYRSYGMYAPSLDAAIVSALLRHVAHIRAMRCHRFFQNGRLVKSHGIWLRRCRLFTPKVPLAYRILVVLVFRGVFRYLGVSSVIRMVTSSEFTLSIVFVHVHSVRSHGNLLHVYV